MTDNELQLALAKMLPEKIAVHTWDSQVAGKKVTNICWRSNQNVIQDTEWLHVCWMVEQAICRMDRFRVDNLLHDYLYPKEPTSHATWQQRAEALLKVKQILPPRPDSPRKAQRH